jgi:hypothetical protein
MTGIIFPTNALDLANRRSIIILSFGQCPCSLLKISLVLKAGAFFMSAFYLPEFSLIANLIIPRNGFCGLSLTIQTPLSARLSTIVLIYALVAYPPISSKRRHGLFHESLCFSKHLASFFYLIFSRKHCKIILYSFDCPDD